MTLVLSPKFYFIFTLLFCIYIATCKFVAILRLFKFHFQTEVLLTSDFEHQHYHSMLILAVI